MYDSYQDFLVKTGAVRIKLNKANPGVTRNAFIPTGAYMRIYVDVTNSTETVDVESDANNTMLSYRIGTSGPKIITPQNIIDGIFNNAQVFNPRVGLESFFKNDKYALNVIRRYKAIGVLPKEIYVSYETLEYVSNRTDLDCYEVLLPNPVSGYGMKIVKDAFTLEEDKYEIVENTKRFSWTRLIKRFKTVGARSMNAKAIIYPYWENMARGLEDVLVPWVFIDLILITFVFVNLCVLFARMWKNRTIHKADVKNFIEKRIEIYREERKQKKEKGELI